MKKLWKQSKMDSVLALLLFAVFAVCVLSVLLTGAKAFRGLSERDQASFDRRTAAQYITTRLRQSDFADGVFLAEFGGGTALTCREKLDGEQYLTRVYYHDGYIYELFCAANAQLRPEDGERIMAVESLVFTEYDGLIIAAVTDADGVRTVVSAAPRSGRESVR